MIDSTLGIWAIRIESKVAQFIVLCSALNLAVA